jgi:sugar phosphate permease
MKIMPALPQLPRARSLRNLESSKWPFHWQVIIVGSLLLTLFSAQIFAGTRAIPAFLFSLCVGISLTVCVFAAGRHNFIAILVLIWTAKVLIVGIVVKSLIGEPTDATLDAPVETALV